MTAISVFSTFTNNHDSQTLELKNLENIYMLSDSHLCLFDGSNYKHFQNQQKIFYDTNTSVIMGIAGMYNIGKKIICNTLSEISSLPAILNAPDLNSKIDEIYKTLIRNTDKFHINNFTYSSTIVCNTVHNREFASLKFYIPAQSKTVKKKQFPIMEKISVSYDGRDGEPFNKFLEGIENYDSLLTPATTHFKAFIDFISSQEPVCSGPPCQGVVLNKNGNVKELSIKHNDKEFYKMGKLHNNKAIRKYEIDFRDTDFTFLSSSKIK